MFSSDSYVKKMRLASLLCIPIFRQTQFVTGGFLTNSS